MDGSTMIVAWRSGTTSRYESLWALMHKFTHLNGATFGDIMAMFDATPKAPWNERARNLDRLDRLDNKKLAQVFEIPEPDIRLLISEAYNIGSKTCATLRYCPVCIKKGFHTAAFQLNSIVKCPLHNVALETQCPTCHYIIDYHLGAKELTTPFGCKCGAVLWAGVTNHLWPRALTTDEEAVFERLLRWVDTIKSNDQRKQHGKWYGEGIYEKNMRGIACIEKVDGWDPDCFGSDGRDVIVSEYDGKWSPSAKRDQPIFPINVGHGSPCGCDNEFANWFNDKHVKDYRQRVTIAITTIKKSLGRHHKCTDGISLFQNATYTKKGYCLFGIAFEKWQDALWRGHWLETECHYRDFGRDSLDPAWGIQSALTAIKGKYSDTMGRKLEPIVLWLALEIFNVRLLCDFAHFVKETIEETKYLQEVGQLRYKWSSFPELHNLKPVIAYYPGGFSRPRVKSYLGFSLRALAKFARSDVGCNCR